MDKRGANSDCEIRKIHGENDIYLKSIKCRYDLDEGKGGYSDTHIITQVKMKEMVKLSGAVQKPLHIPARFQQKVQMVHFEEVVKMD